jgi:hypothetical protein
MPIPPLNIDTAQLVLTMPVDQLLQPTVHVKNELAAALKGEFEQLVDLPVPDGAPPNLPFVLFQRDSTTISASALQVDYQTTFDGGHRASFADCHDFMAKRCSRLLKALKRVGASPVWEGQVVTLQASMSNDDELAPLRHISDTLLRPELDDERLHDVQVNFGFRMHDRYFVTINVGEYESKQVTQTVSLGGTSKPIRPWDAETVDRGLVVGIDVNNRYGALLEKRHTQITETDVLAMNDLTWQLVEQVAVPLARDGMLDMGAIEGVAA